MILRILKRVSLDGMRAFSPGAVVNISKDVADEWIASGKAKHYNGSSFVEEKAVSPPENKMEIPPENKGEGIKSKPKRKRKK